MTRWSGLIAGSAALLALTAAAAPAGAAAPASGPRLVLRSSLPGVVRIGQRVTISGRVRRARRGSSVALESRRELTTRWRIMAVTTVRGGGSFRLRWRIGHGAATGPLALRVAVLRHGRVLTASTPTQSDIGPAIVSCAPPVPPAVDIPVGDGWIVGGVYDMGGPFPGIDSCSTVPYTVRVADAAGTTVATQDVAALRSYTIVVPAGRYTLTSGGCRGSATVTAGRQTTADTDCDFP